MYHCMERTAVCETSLPVFYIQDTAVGHVKLAMSDGQPNPTFLSLTCGRTRRSLYMMYLGYALYLSWKLPAVSFSE